MSPRPTPAPRNAAALQTWLDDEQDLAARAPLHRAAIAGPADVKDVVDAWLREQTTQLLADVAVLAALRPRVAERLRFAAGVERRTLVEPASAWAEAAARVGRDPRFAATPGFVLRPQLGLVPLGADPRSGLEEFGHVQSGALPERGADGALRIDDGSCIVLVLVPGGRVTIGAVPPAGDSAAAAGAPNVDPAADAFEGPLVAVVLDPYFISKFELTQGQWLRHAGENPASYRADSKWVDDVAALRHPVETVSWDQCDRVLRELDLGLPTEAQWERAARGGAGDPWWCGRDRATLAGVENLADRFARDNGGHDAWHYEPWLDDGFVVHAPVGSFRANPFGLHDVHGNVHEWCRDTWEDRAIHPPRDGDGLCSGVETARTFHGGSFTSDAGRARASRRDGFPSHLAPFQMGVRPARAVERDPE